MYNSSLAVLFLILLSFTVQNILERKKALAGYRAYDEDEELAVALGHERSVLSKYDDEIDKDAAARSRGFRIGDDAALRAERAREALVGCKLNGWFSSRICSSIFDLGDKSLNKLFRFLSVGKKFNSKKYCSKF